MAKIKVKIKQGSQGKPLGVRIAEFRAKEGGQGKLLYKPKAKMMIHFNDGRE